MGVARSDEARDASRRTRLANERTYLAWWRTGLTTFAVSLAAGKLVPELSSGASWPFEVIGVAFGVVGLLIAIAGAAASWALIERPALERAHSLGARLRQPRPATVAGLTQAALGGESPAFAPVVLEVASDA